MSKFELRPLKEYKGAHYPAAWRKEAPDDELKKSPPSLARCLFTGLLAFGLLFGLIGCFGDVKGKLTEQADAGILPNIDGGDSGDGGDEADSGDIMLGVMAECTPGDVMCADNENLATCNEDYYYDAARSCEEICDEEFADSSAYSLGCDAQAEDPCQCQYDMVPGVMVECTPGEVQCREDNQYVECTEDYYLSDPRSCDELCAESDMMSYGCNEAVVENPCQCGYDILDGEPALCTPGIIECQEDDVALICADDGYGTSQVSCDDHCAEQDMISIGCTTLDRDNFCGCKDE